MAKHQVPSSARTPAILIDHASEPGGRSNRHNPESVYPGHLALGSERQLPGQSSLPTHGSSSDDPDSASEGQGSYSDERHSESDSSESSPDESESLDTVLRNHAAHHAERNTHQVFWGYKRLRDLLTEERVMQELQSDDGGRMSHANAAKWCQRILPPPTKKRQAPTKSSKRTYLCIFALLVLADRTRDVGTFLTRELSDEKISSADPALIKDKIKKCRWRNTQCDAFEKHHRGVIVPFFDTGAGSHVEVKHLDLHDETLLPWLMEGSEGHDSRTKRGGFGSVTKYKIDPYSHNFRRLLDPVALYSEYVAVKCLNSGQHRDAEVFDNEVNMLKRFGVQGRQMAANPHDRAHRHVITLLATYTIGGQRCMVFPAAQCDLDEYFKQTPGPLQGKHKSSSPTLNVTTLRWLSDQVVGLVAALNLMHAASRDNLGAPDKYARHGDLKLENILWFKSQLDERGIFVIGDLGIADIHGEFSRSMVNNENLAMTPTYRAPECDIKNATISRAYDIWSLGCVFLEIIAWMMGGNEQREMFAQSRMKTSVFKTKTNIYFNVQKLEDGRFSFKVNEKVIKTIMEFHSMPNCTPYIHDLLDIISADMLRVKPRDRIGSKRLLQKLEALHDKGISQPDYLVKPQPMLRREGKNCQDEWIADDLNPIVRQAFEAMMDQAERLLKGTGTS